MYMMLYSAVQANVSSVEKEQHEPVTMLRVIFHDVTYIWGVVGEASGEGSMKYGRLQQQGDPLGMLLFSLVAQPIVLNIQAQFRPILNVWMADDGNFIAPIEDISRIYEYIKNEGPAYGLHIQESKTKFGGQK